MVLFVWFVVCMTQELKDYINGLNLNFLFYCNGDFWYEDWRGKKMFSLKELEKNFEKSLT